jgi:tetratricopeptide (TPR) repeat protein
MGLKCILWISVCVLIGAAGSGCAVPEPLAHAGPSRQERPPWLHSSWSLWYSPQVQPGATFEGALKDLEAYLHPAKGGQIHCTDLIYRPDRNWVTIRSCVANDRMLQIHAVDRHPDPQLNDGPVDVTLHFSDLPDQRIYVTQARQKTVQYAIVMPNLMGFYFYQPTHVRAIADALCVIQQRYRELDTERRAAFESKAAAYRALVVKPPISEEQRKLIVQANALNERKDYAGTIELYLKAIDLDPVSYPGAYFNLALFSAQMKRYNTAIDYMKQYLLLEPGAADARSAQDKIYEWELLAKKHL